MEFDDGSKSTNIFIKEEPFDCSSYDHKHDIKPDTGGHSLENFTYDNKFVSKIEENISSCVDVRNIKYENTEQSCTCCSHDLEKVANSEDSDTKPLTAHNSCHQLFDTKNICTCTNVTQKTVYYCESEIKSEQSSHNPQSFHTHINPASWNTSIKVDPQPVKKDETSEENSFDYHSILLTNLTDTITNDEKHPDDYPKMVTINLNDVEQGM